MALSAKHEKLINFEIALQYPLCLVPLSLVNPDGSRRKTTKSALMKVVISYESSTDEEETTPPKQNSAFLVDLMALIRTISPIPVTYAELVKILVDRLPKGYRSIDIIADTYREKSLKNNEIDRRGDSNKVIVRSALSKIPRNFSDYLKNGDNKTRRTELIKDEFVKHSHDYLQLLSSEVIYFSIDGLCLQIKQERVIEASQLSSNQEEADTKVLLHANHALHENIDQNVVLRSPSGDIDINILCIAMFSFQAERIWIDYGTGDNRKFLKLNSIDMDEEKKLALLGFHAATGNDYVSSFFR